MIRQTTTKVPLKRKKAFSKSALVIGVSVGVLQVLVDDARLGEHSSAVDEHRDQARGIEREKFGLELMKAPARLQPAAFRRSLISR